MNRQFKNKCAFCKYSTRSGCMVTPNSYYCKEANDEFYRYLHNKKNPQLTKKSLRSWDKNNLN